MFETTKNVIFNDDQEIMNHLVNSYKLATNSISNLSDNSLMSVAILNYFGMSGLLTRHFINNLANCPGMTYAEIGTHLGSTLMSALYGNNIKALCCDNWSQFGGPKDMFFKNIKTYLSYESAEQSLVVSEYDFNDEKLISSPVWKNIDFYFFDGPHDKKSQYDGLVKYIDNLSNRFLFMVDDWHWSCVQEGTREGLKHCDIEILSSVEIDVEDEKLENRVVTNRFQHSNWHNGIAVFACKKNQLSPNKLSKVSINFCHAESFKSELN